MWSLTQCAILVVVCSIDADDQSIQHLLAHCGYQCECIAPRWGVRFTPQNHSRSTTIKTPQKHTARLRETSKNECEQYEIKTNNRRKQNTREDKQDRNDDMM